MSNALAGADLTLAYDGRTVVREADITLHAGEVVALVGPNGSGKSTLLRALARLHAPQSGTVRLDADQDALALRPQRLRAAGHPADPVAPDAGRGAGARRRRVRAAPVPGTVRRG